MQKIAGSLDEGGYLVLSVYNKEKIPATYGRDLELMAGSCDLERGDLFVAYRHSPNNKTAYYSHWFTEEELESLGKKVALEIDFLEHRMARLVSRFRKITNG